MLQFAAPFRVCNFHGAQLQDYDCRASSAATSKVTFDITSATADGSVPLPGMTVA